MIVSRSERARPAAQTAPNDEPYSTMPLLFAVPPDEVRDVVHVGMRAGRDRGEADGCERREGRSGTAILAVLREEAQRGSGGALEHRRRETVDHDQHDGFRHRRQSRASVRRPA